MFGHLTVVEKPQPSAIQAVAVARCCVAALHRSTWFNVDKRDALPRYPTGFT